MTMTTPKLKTCVNGHQFYKSSDCPSCPICEQQRKPKDNFLALIGAPARRALEREGITTLKKLSTYTEKEILNLHGMGKSTLPKLFNALKEAGLKFSSENTATHTEYRTYNDSQNSEDKQICNLLAETINQQLKEAENKLWHGHPVWFINGNPIVGYSKQKNGIRLMFWSGADFEEEKLNVRGGKFKDASIFFNSVTEINIKDLKRWLKKSKEIQWDYKNIVKRKGKLVRIET
jgi:uncharacterized protein YdhG (YjbR/CyaY superfamily)